MSARTVLLGIAGLALAVTVGFAANAISRDSIGLAPTPAGSGVRLAPQKTTSAPARTSKPKAKRPKRTRPSRTTTGTTPAPTTTSGGDDHGGRGGSGSSGGSGRGRGGGDD